LSQRLPLLDGDTLTGAGWVGAGPAADVSGELDITCPGGGGVMPGSLDPLPAGALDAG